MHCILYLFDLLNVEYIHIYTYNYDIVGERYRIYHICSSSHLKLYKSKNKNIKMLSNEFTDCEKLKLNFYKVKVKVVTTNNNLTSAFSKYAYTYLLRM